MHTPHDGDGVNHPDAFGHALRALPLAVPPHDLWPALERSLAPARRRRWLVPTALAASFLLGLVWMRTVPREAGDAAGAPNMPVATATTASPSEIEQLRAQSHQLERWLAARPAQSALDAPTLMAAAEVEDLVGFVDVQLSAARDNAEALPLWRQRVALLEDLALIRTTDQFETAALAGDPAFLPTSL